MKHLKHAAMLTILLSLALVFAGCAKPPDEEKSATQAAYDAAVAAGAEHYAAAEFGEAKGIWDNTEALMSSKKYKEAKQGYFEAKTAFEKATAAVEAGKKVVAEEVNTALTGMEGEWTTLAAAVKKVEKSLEDKKDAWADDSKAFEEGFKAAKETAEADPAGAKSKIAELKEIMERWDTFIKELPPPPPAKPQAPKKR